MPTTKVNQLLHYATMLWKRAGEALVSESYHQRAADAAEGMDSENFYTAYAVAANALSLEAENSGQLAFTRMIDSMIRRITELNLPDLHKDDIKKLYGMTVKELAIFAPDLPTHIRFIPLVASLTAAYDLAHYYAYFYFRDGATEKPRAFVLNALTRDLESRGLAHAWNRHRFVQITPPGSTQMEFRMIPKREYDKLPKVRPH